MWQWTLRCYATLRSGYSCSAELHQQSVRDISVTLHRPRMGAGQGKAGGGSTLALFCSFQCLCRSLCQTLMQKSHDTIVSLQRTKCNRDDQYKSIGILMRGILPPAEQKLLHFLTKCIKDAYTMKQCNF